MKRPKLRALVKASAVSMLFNIFVALYAVLLVVRMSVLPQTTEDSSINIKGSLKDLQNAPLALQMKGFRSTISRTVLVKKRQVPARPSILEPLHPGQPRNNGNATTRSRCEQLFKKVSSDNMNTIPPSRIPTYVDGCFQTPYFGFVFRDLINRFFPHLDRLVVRPTHLEKPILVVSKDSGKAQSETKLSTNQALERAQQKYGYMLGPSFLLSAKARGYSWAQGLDDRSKDNSNLLDDWWSSPASGDAKSSGIGLALLDIPTRTNNQDWQKTFFNSSLFWKEARFDYLVYRTVITNDKLYGIELSRHLLRKGYNLQVLSSSYEASYRNNATSVSMKSMFQPNALLTNEKDLETYFNYRRWVSKRTDRNTPSKYDTTNDRDSDPHMIVSYLFATKRLDLAIPSAQTYINLTGKEEADIVLDVNGDNIPFLTCQKTIARLRWVPTQNPYSNNNVTTLTIKEVVEPQCYKSSIDGVWYSASSPGLSEAFCLKCQDPNRRSLSRVYGDTACIARFLPNRKAAPQLNPDPSMNSTSNQTSGMAVSRNRQDRPNVLYIRLDQVSMGRFKKNMPQTKSALEAFGMFAMEKYMLSEPPKYNQSWHPLQQGDGWAQHLHDEGYAVLNLQNGCILDPGTSQTIQTYGWQLNEMFCHHQPSRPNCVGGIPASKHLFDYTSQFVNYHRRRGEPWVAFLSLIEGQEDTTVLPKSIDTRLLNFLTKLKNSMSKSQWGRTAIVVTSDRGLTQGSFSQTYLGQQEMLQPLLYLKGASKKESAAIQRNRRYYIAPRDLLLTLKSLISGSPQSRSYPAGQNIFSDFDDTRSFCHKASKSSDALCQLVNGTDLELEKKISVGTHFPPSILSFYADIPINNRKHVNIIEQSNPGKRMVVVPGCQCATNINTWFPCDSHPWLSTDPAQFKEYFMLVECPNQSTHLEIRVVRNHVVLGRSVSRLQKLQTKRKKPLPNIIFLELDSVSVAYADRHFPKTREFLRQYRVQQNGTGYQCKYGICSADFSNRISLAGANSIPNQVAALSGCLSSDYNHLCGLVEPAPRLICNDPSEPHYGLQIQRVRPGARQVYWCPAQSDDLERRISPWIYAITDSMGYINFFGEEFCFEGSPYVTQGNVYPMFFADIESHRVFCRLAEQRIKRENATVADEFRWGWERQDQACVDSDAEECTFEKAKISLEIMEQVWATYKDSPKFAFLNVLAAHVYNADWSKLFTMAERYDHHLVNFLESMLSRPDADNTIIIVRSDHGLQRGPMAMEYSLQAEHLQPWTEILVPEKLHGISKKALFRNQDRLVSGHDLYHTIREAIAEDSPETTDILPPLPDWTFNVASKEIPETRSCHEARVDPKLCREESRPPSFGICNSLDGDQAKFCRDYKVVPDMSAAVLSAMRQTKARTYTQEQLHSLVAMLAEGVNKTS